MGAPDSLGGGRGDEGHWTDRLAAEPQATDPRAAIRAGIVLGGKYRLISEIGRGGMGAVWRAEHLEWEAPVALKIMNRDITAHPEAVARFEREVRLAAGLRSPHVVQVLDHGVDYATRTPYIAMELLEGESLARRIKRAGPLSPAELFRVFSQLMRALTRAHSAGIVHRDLKPDNVFLVRNEEESLTKVLDFGVAKWTAPDITESGLTRPGSVVGTPFYMSPEQIQGSREIDHRADLWALAAIACECLTGRRPFEAPDFAQLAVLLLGNTSRPLPSSLGPVPPHFDAWFLRATDPDISRRFQNVREMAQALAPICGVAPSSVGSDSFPARDLTFTRQEAPSMTPVSNAASRMLSDSALDPRGPYSAGLYGGLWQRPMVKLVATTAITTLVVMSGVFIWFVRQPSGASKQGTTQVSTSTGAAPVTNKATVGPIVRPIGPLDAQQNPSPPAKVSEQTPLVSPERSPDRPDSVPAPEPVLNDDFDPVAAQKSVRAGLLARPKTRAKPKKPRAEVRAPANTSHPEPAPPPRATTPAAPSDNKPSLVDGRHIRTTL
jgi:serine/threonine-protein kinase